MNQATANLLEARPRRTACTVERQYGALDAAYVLKDAGGRHYMRLSEEGLFIWQLMDGRRSIRDLCQAYAATYQRPLDMQAIARLVENGFIEIEGLSNQMRQGERPVLRRILGLCTCYWWLSDMDRPVSALYAWTRRLYTPAAQLAMFLCAAAGFMIFAAHWALTGAGTGASMDALPVWIAALALHVVIHEAAHAATCKHFGRAVHRLGIGWYFFAPVAFVDTSDCWAAPRQERILVSAAGPYSNVVLSGIAALIAILQPAGLLADALWSFCAIGYVLAIVNMNPLLELDGYYVAMDLLDVPDLRSRALGALVAALRGRCAWDRQRQLRGILVAFGAASLAYGLVVVAAILGAGRAQVETVAAMALPHTQAQALAWMLAGLMSLLALNRVLADLLKGWHAHRSGA
jgi:putative peptide zinc metalloprotease protein